MAELGTKKAFNSEYVDPSDAEKGINGGYQFEGSDVLFADDLNKIVNNEKHLKESKSDKGHTHTPEEIGAAPAVHRHGYSDLTDVAAASHTHTFQDLSGVAAAGHTHSPSAIGAAAANHTHSLESLEAAPARHTHTASEIGAHTHSAKDIETGLIVGNNGISVSRSSTGVYTVSGEVPALMGYRYSRQTIGTNTSCSYDSYDLTRNKDKGTIQVLFLRLSQAETGYTIDIPIEMLILMFHTQQSVDVLNITSNRITMQVTNCILSKNNVSHKYMDIDLTAKFSFISKGGYSGNALRAEWWGRPLEKTYEPTGY